MSPPLLPSKRMAIRRAVEAGQLTLREIMREFGVGRGTVDAIARAVRLRKRNGLTPVPAEPRIA